MISDFVRLLHQADEYFASDRLPFTRRRRLQSSTRRSGQLELWDIYYCVLELSRLLRLIRLVIGVR